MRALSVMGVALSLGAGLTGCNRSGSQASTEPVPADSGKQDEAEKSSEPGKRAQPLSSPGTGAEEAEEATDSGEIRVGQKAPDFSVTAHTGETVSLSDLRGQAVVLYFYPKDGTPGCTEEAKQFREHHEDLKSQGVVVLGVSSDDNESHEEFARELGLPFRLLPDPDRQLAKAYGVGGFLGMSRRVTFLIDKQGKIAKIYPSVTPKQHATEILGDLAALGIQAG